MPYCNNHGPFAGTICSICEEFRVEKLAKATPVAKTTPVTETASLYGGIMLPWYNERTGYPVRVDPVTSQINFAIELRFDCTFWQHPAYNPLQIVLTADEAFHAGSLLYGAIYFFRRDPQGALRRVPRNDPAHPKSPPGQTAYSGSDVPALSSTGLIDILAAEELPTLCSLTLSSVPRKTLEQYLLEIP